MTLENVTPSYQSRENYYVRKGLTPLPEPHLTGMKLLADVTMDSAPIIITSVEVTSTSKTITFKAWAADTVTITTGTSHGFDVGTKVAVSGLGSPYDGNFEIYSVPSADTFTYKVSTRTVTAVTTTAASGSAISSEITLTATEAHGLRASQKIIVDYLTGNAAIANGTWTVASITTETITYTVPDVSATGTYTGLKGSVITRLTLNTIDEGGVVWVCTDVNGWWTLAEPEFPEVAKAFGDGTYDASGRFLARILTLEGSILCPSPEFAPAARDYFSEAVSLVYKGAWLKTTERQVGTTSLSITDISFSNDVLTFTCPGHRYSVGETVSISSATLSKVVSGTSGSSTLTVGAGGSVSGLVVGATVSGTGIDSGTLVTSISDGSTKTITLSKPLTATISSSARTFTIPTLQKTFEICAVDTSVHDSETFSVYMFEETQKTVKLATTGNISSLSGALTVDGVAVVTGDRILVKNQTTASQNGIYVADTAGAWSRATDFDEANSSEIYAGTKVRVTNGTANKNSTWILNSAISITVGSTNLPFTSLSSFVYNGTLMTSFSASVTTGEIVKASFVRLSGQPEITSTTARGRLDFSIGLQAADPVKYQWADTYDGTQQIRFIPKNIDTSATGIQTITNSGNYPVGVTLEITGPVIGPMNVTNQTTDKRLIVSGGLDGDSVSFVVVEKEVVNDVATLRTEGPHGRRKGTGITVANVDATYNGTYSISKVPTDTRLSYDKPLNITKDITQFSLGRTVNISHRARSGFVATYTTSAVHGFTAGMEVVIASMDDAAFNGVFNIDTVPTTTTFTCTIGTSGTLTTTSDAGTAKVAGLVTVTSASHALSAGTLVTVKNVDPAVNVENAEIITSATNTFTYYATRTRIVDRVTFDNTTSNSANDAYTVYTTDYHGYRVGDTIRLFGCGRPFNSTSSATTVATVTKVNQRDKSFTFVNSTFSRTISAVQVAARPTGGYRVKVTTSTAHGFVNGDTVNLSIKVKGTATFPTGINGDKTIRKIDNTNFFYDTTRPSLSAAREKEYFGSTIPEAADPLNYASISIESGQKVNYADITERKINKSSGGSVTNVSTIASEAVPESKNGFLEVLSLARTAVTGGTATVTVDPEVLTIDTGKRSATLDSDAEYAMAKIDPSGDWITLAPGSNQIKTVDVGNDTSTASIIVKYRSGWLS